MSAHVLAAIDDDGKTCVSYRRFDPEIKLYKLNLDESSYEEKSPFLLKDQDSGKELLSSLVSDAGN